MKVKRSELTELVRQAHRIRRELRATLIPGSAADNESFDELLDELIEDLESLREGYRILVQ